MRMLKLPSSYTAVVAFLTGRVYGVPAISRQVTESGPDPWISVNSNGSAVATISPVLTTIRGVVTTISAAPASPTATTTSTGQASQSLITSAGAIPTGTEGGAFQVCHNTNGPFAPFCKPENGSSVYVGETYYVTWDTTYLPEHNMTILIQANYANASIGGPQAYQSPFQANNLGFLAWTISKDWLQGLKANYLILYMFPLNPLSTEPTSILGPTLTVTTRPAEVYRQPLTKAPKGQSLYIALPSVFGFILLCVIGGYWWNRKSRSIGLGSVMGRRKGYGVGKSRSQRLGLGLGKRGRKGGDIMLRERDLAEGRQYRDRPEVVG